jgi:hypothetical protein
MKKKYIKWIIIRRWKEFFFIDIYELVDTKYENDILRGIK